MGKVYTYHRKPTPWEVKWGYGAMHYIDLAASIVRRKDGTLKRYVVIDGLRYYR